MIMKVYVPLMDTLTAEDLAPAIQEHNNVTPEEMAFFVRNELKAYLAIDIFQFLAYWKWYLLVASTNLRRMNPARQFYGRL